MIRKILIVDDTVFFRSLVKEMLTPQGYEVLEASSGTEGIALYRDQKPDLVLMDFNMPEMDGFAASRALFEIDPKARIVLCTGIQTEALMTNSHKLPFATILAKPFRADVLLAAIQSLDQTGWTPPGTVSS